MRFSGKKKKGRGFSNIAGGSQTPGAPKAPIPGIPGVPGTGIPSGMKTPEQRQKRQPLYGRKVAAKKSSRTPLIIAAIVVVAVIVCILVAVLT